MKALDALVHLNALLPSFIVYWTLHDLKSAWLAVLLYETVCLVGLPLATVYLRTDAEKRLLRARLKPLTRPHRRCAVITTGSLFFFGLGGFAVYLGLAQREFETWGVSRAIHKHSEHTGLQVETPNQAFALVVLGVWFCTVNPVLEEVFWRGYCYAELARLHKGVARWLTSVYFASFHAVVLLVFVNKLAALATLLFMACVGRAWILLVETPLFGFPFVVAFHAGADVAVVLVFSACDFGWALRRTAYLVALLASSLLATLGALLLVLAWNDTFLPCTTRAASILRADDVETSNTAVPLMRTKDDNDSPDSSPTLSPVV